MAGRQRKSDVDTETAILVVEQEKLLEDGPRQQQEERDRLIAQTHQMIGQIKAADMLGKFANVSSLVWLRQMKESKVYRDLPGFKTWEDFCNYIGLSRQKVDLDLQNLATFGEEFLLTVSSLSVGYRDLRKLRHLTHDGSIMIDAEAIEVGGERVPLAPEYKEDLQALIERVLDEKNKALADANKANDRLLEEKGKTIQARDKEIEELKVKAAAKKMTLNEAGFLQAMNRLRLCFDDDYMPEVNPETAMADLPEVTPRMRAALISTIDYMKMEISATYDAAINLYGNPALIPELDAEINAFVSDYEAWATKIPKVDA